MQLISTTTRKEREKKTFTSILNSWLELEKEPLKGYKGSVLPFHYCTKLIVDYPIHFIIVVVVVVVIVCVLFQYDSLVLQSIHVLYKLLLQIKCHLGSNYSFLDGCYPLQS